MGVLRFFSAWSSLAMAATLCVGLANAKPNFVIFMADDLGYGDLGATGNKDVETPNIDSLAAESVFFPNFYVAPVCAPTRAALLTGRYPLRTGVWGVHGGRDYINLDESTIGNVLSDAGYATGLFGKWHNGKSDGYFPWQRGFREACTTELYHYLNNKATCNGRTVQTGGWVQDTIASWATNFIDRKTSEGLPFLLYVPFMTPHLGYAEGGQPEYWHARADLIQKYLAKGLSHGLSTLYGMIEMMDSAVGRVLNHLDESGLGDDTVVMFFSDNGATGQHLMDDWWRRNHHGLKGEKGQVTENGVRSPLFVRWRGNFPGGTVAPSQLAMVEDILPTVADIAGAAPGAKPLDGVSLTPVLYNPEEDGGFSQRTLYHTIMAPEWTRFGGYQLLPDFGKDKSGLILGREGRWAARQGNWKLINWNGGEALYNLADDRQESAPSLNLEMMDHLRSKLWNWWQGILKDSGSFTVPVFFIGYPGSSSGLILPSGAGEKSGDWTLFEHSTEGNVVPGNYLKYKVIVARTGTFNIRVKKWGEWFGSLEFKVVCGESISVAGGEVQPGGYVATMEISQAGQNCFLTMTVTSGEGFIKLLEIRFDYAGAPPGLELQSG
ncbi:hypothetical protein BSKO_05244 [Bryopsis sp. KO-2023]|nr:hypothetical protein BSKO_05244 [Bryopsis sp. KO-2023]